MGFSRDLGKPPHRSAHHRPLEFLEVLHLLVGNRDVDRDSGRLASVEWLESPVVDNVVQQAGDHDCRSCVPYLQAVGDLQLGNANLLERELAVATDVVSIPSHHSVNRAGS